MMNGQAIVDLTSVPFSVVSFRATLSIGENFDMIRRVETRLDDGELVIVIVRPLSHIIV